MFQLQSQLAKLMSESSEDLMGARSAHEQLEKLSGQVSGTLADAVSAFEKKISALLGGGGFFAPPSPKPTLGRVNGEASTLYAEIGRADATPTIAQLSATAETEKSFADVSRQWKQLKTVNLPALNKQLHDANLPEIHLETQPPEADDGDDID